MKKSNIISVVLILTVLGLILYRGHSPSSNSSKPVTVIINDQGFSPDYVTIAKGTTVTWVNEGSRLHWPASNPHPIHTSYPDEGGCIGSLFDACHGLKNGEKYSFQFNVLGSWGAHDHMFPGSVMVINVVDNTSTTTASTFDKNKIPTNEEFRAMDYGKQLEVIKAMATNDQSATWAYLKANFIINGQVVGNAHEMAHIVGNLAFEKFGLDGVKICDETFAFGCFHGVTEKMLLTQGLSNIKSIEKGCLKVFPPERSQNYTGCIHGIGHGVYSFEGDNLKKALLDCDVISEPYRQYCYDGVFMENSFRPESKIFDPKNPWKFCTDLDEIYHRNCARYQSQVFLGNSGTINSASIVGKNCALGPSVLLRETCFESLGYYIAQSTLGVPADILKSCNQMSSREGKDICIKGGAIETIFQHYGNFKDSANQLCKSLAEPKQGECLKSIQNMLALYSNEN